MSKNPFKIGEMVSGDPFCNRKKEIGRLKSAFQSGQNVILISPRRWGKSSLVQEALRQTRKSAIVIELDCFGITSEQMFLEVYLKALIKASQNHFDKITDILKKYIASVVPFISFSYGLNDDIKIGLELQKGKTDVAAILQLPARLQKAKKIPVVVCIDEFQKIMDWPNGTIFMETMRAAWQKHSGVAYCLYGSKRHLMNQIFNDGSNPFYRFGETVFLEKISRADWTSFLTTQFTKSGKEIPKTLAEQLADMTECHSYYVQYLARLVWHITPNKVTPSILAAGYRTFLSDHVAMFRVQTETLTYYQTNYLKALISGETKFTSNKVLRHYDLGSPGNIKRIETALEKSEIIDTFTGKPVLSEPYFAPLFREQFIRS